MSIDSAKRQSLSVLAKDRHGKVLAECKTESHPLIKGAIPVVLLVNTYTVSAAEILAQVLAYYSAQGTIAPRIIIAGTKTHGKGIRTGNTASWERLCTQTHNCFLCITCPTTHHFR